MDFASSLLSVRIFHKSQWYLHGEKAARLSSVHWYDRRNVVGDDRTIPLHELALKNQDLILIEPELHTTVPATLLLSVFDVVSVFSLQHGIAECM